MKKFYLANVPIFLASFCLSVTLTLGAIYLFWGTPGLQTGPWTLQQMGALKRMELLTYIFSTAGIILLTFLFSWIFATINRRNRAGSLEERPLPPESHPGNHSITSVAIFIVVINILASLALYRAMQRPNMGRPLEASDEGLILGAANQALHGKKAFQEIYFQYGPLYEIVQPLLAFRCFGVSIEAVRRMEWVVYPLGFLAVFWCSILIFGRWWPPIVFSLFILGMMDYWISSRSFFSAMTVFFLLAYCRTRKPISQRVLACVAGFMAGLGQFYSLEGGLFVLGASLLFFMLLGSLKDTPYSKKGFLFFLLGYGLVVAAFSVVQLFHGNFTAFVDNIYLMGPSWAPAWGKPTPLLYQPIMGFIRQPWTFFSTGGIWMRWWFPVIIYLLLFIFSLRRGFRIGASPRMAQGLLLSIMGLTFFCFALGRSDYEHWVRANLFLWLIVFFILREIIHCIRTVLRNRELDWKEKAATAAPLSFTLALIIFYGATGFHWMVMEEDLKGVFHHNSVSSQKWEGSDRVGGLPWDSTYTSNLQNIAAELRRYSGSKKSAYIFSNDATFYFLANVINPTRYANSTFVITENMANEVVRDLKDKKPPCIMVRWDGEAILAKPYHRDIVEFIEKHYQRERVIPPWAFFISRQDGADRT